MQLDRDRCDAGLAVVEVAKNATPVTRALAQIRIWERAAVIGRLPGRILPAVL